VLRPAVLTQSLSRQKWRFAAPRAEANKRLKLMLPLVGVYRTGERFRLDRQLWTHRYNDLLEIRASFARAKKARQPLFPKPKHGKIVMKCDAETGSVLLVVGTVHPGGRQRVHCPPPVVVAPDSRNLSKSLCRTRQNLAVGRSALKRPCATALSRNRVLQPSHCAAWRLLR